MKLTITQNNFEILHKFVDLLKDNTSKELFMARLNYSISDDLDEFLKVLMKEEKSYIYKIESFFQNKDKSKVLVYGAGIVGKRLKKILDDIGISINAFIDNDKSKQQLGVEGIKVIGVEELKTGKYNDYSIILSSRKYEDDTYNSLIEINFPENQILTATSWLYCKNQYFDLEELPHKDGEIFIDGGSLDFSTSLDFIKWCNNNFEKIYVFEPDNKNMENCKLAARKYDCSKIEFINFGTWSKKTTLKFMNGWDGCSHISDEGTSVIEVISIDEVLNGKPCTFIKLDIEGAELETLKGAVKTIKQHRPKMAISIYHKPEDIVEIPAFLMENFPNYNYYIRHYCLRPCETILYAIPAE